MISQKELAMIETDSFLEEESTTTESTDEKRETWGSSRTFILALLGYAVGLGNVWRFPYLCYAYGGGAFLIPYFFFVAVAGLPMFFLEISLGQFTRLSAIEVWKIAPIMKGIGYGCALVNGFCSIYYITVLAWSTLYLFHSVMPGDLPWTHCNNWWNTENCTSLLEPAVNKSIEFVNSTSVSATVTASSSAAAAVANSSISAFVNNRGSLPAAEFWRYYVLRQSSGIGELGSFDNYPMIIAFIFSWVFIYFCVFKGVSSSGKIVYFSATAPYVMLTVLFFRGITLPGAAKGIAYLFKPDFEKLMQSETWVSAGSQIFYTFGICFTVLFAFGSYNPKKNNCYNQAVALVFSGCATSVFSSFVIFSILGHLSHTLGVEMKDVADKVFRS